MGRVSVGAGFQGEIKGSIEAGRWFRSVRTRMAAAPTRTLRRLFPLSRALCVSYSSRSPPTSPGPHPPAPSTLRRSLREDRVRLLGCKPLTSILPGESQCGTTQMCVRLLTIAVFAALLAVATCQDTEHPELEQCKVQVSAAPRTSPDQTPNSTGQICAPERTHHLTRPSPSLPRSTMTLASGSRSSAISIRRR